MATDTPELSLVPDLITAGELQRLACAALHYVPEHTPMRLEVNGEHATLRNIDGVVILQALRISYPDSLTPPKH